MSIFRFSVGRSINEFNLRNKINWTLSLCIIYKTKLNLKLILFMKKNKK